MKEKLEGMGIRKQLLVDLKGKRRHWNLKEETLDGNVWRTALEEATDLSQERQRNEWMNEWTNEWMHEWMSEWMNE